MKTLLTLLVYYSTIGLMTAADEITIRPLVPDQQNPLFTNGQDIQIVIQENGVGEIEIKSTKKETVIYAIKNNSAGKVKVSIINDNKTISQVAGNEKGTAFMEVGKYFIRCESKEIRSAIINIGYIK